MSYKSEAVTTLDRINKGDEVSNEIFMYNAPNQTGYNTRMQRVERLERMDVRTTKPHSPCKNKMEIVIKIIKGKSKRTRVQINIPKKLWDFVIVYEYEIYS